MVTHPAKYNNDILSAIADLLPEGSSVIDVMAGTGKIFELERMVPGVKVTAIEIEPEWAAVHPRTQVGNALELNFPSGSFDFVVTSPSYGNRLSDHYAPKDQSKRYNYRNALGRDLHPDNAGRLQWGEKYREFHKRAWTEAVRVIAPKSSRESGFILNIKDHVRNGEVQRVSEWHFSVLLELGLSLSKVMVVPCSGNRHGRNSEARVPFEYVYKFVR